MSQFSVNHTVIFDYMQELAETIMIPRFKKLQQHEKQEKKPGDYVTIVDLEMEDALEKILANIIQGSYVVGEEAANKKPEILKQLSQFDWVWVVDPLDGTNNFAHGNRKFCIMISLLYKGEIISSWIYDPLTESRLSAEKGSGTYLNQQKMLMQEVSDFQQMKGQLNYLSFSDEKQRSLVKEKTKDSFLELKRLGCAGHDFLLHVQNKRHFSLYKKLAPWDFLPGQILLSEAGGKVAPLNEDLLRPFEYSNAVLTAVSAGDWYKIKRYLTLS